MKVTKKLWFCLWCLLVIAFSLVASLAFAQRPTDKLDRGLVAIPANTNGGSGSGNFVSWRIMGEEYYDVTYNLYANGSLLAEGLKVSNYNHTSGNASTEYQVAAVVRGVEQEKSASVKRWSAGYWDIPVQPTTDRDGNVSTSHYVLNDISVADVTGDGKMEFIVKRLSDIKAKMSNTTTFSLVECYDMSGKRLWWIDCGPNMMSNGDVELNAVAYDWDDDGRAEVIMRGADNMIIHKGDGTTVEVGDMTVDTRWEDIEYTTKGREFLLYLDGLTGTPYPIGPNGRLWMDYPLPRYDEGETTDPLGSSAEGEIWGGGIPGHRPTKHYFGAPFLDGQHASIFLGRGCYTRHKMVALDVNPATHQLSERWRWKEYDSSSPWFGNGYHNFAVADVDWDGRDEIVFGSMVIDDNGKGLSTTGLGHGDAQHCGDLDPYRHGQEQFACNEEKPSMNYRDATTSKIYYRLVGTDDDGRALCGNFSNAYPGCMGRSVGSAMISTVADKPMTGLSDYVAWSDLNFRIYWDGDLLDEVLNSPGTEKDAVVIKPGTGRIFTSSGCQMGNWTKNNPAVQGDILGDWREEIVLRAENNTKIRIYTTPHSTTYRIPTLWHDHQYRQAMVWQCVGYNQPPHVSYFLGQLEGITTAPPTLTNDGRTQVSGSITGAQDGKHLQVSCFDGDQSITVSEGAKPYIATFNVPSWVQGTNSNKTDGTAVINREYRTCTLTGGAFAGDMRLVKQGDGTLVLPDVEQKYTGNTDIWAGTLRFNGTLTSSDLWLNRFAVLETSGGKYKSVKMDYAAQLRPSGDATVDSLALGFGSRIQYNMYSDGLKSDVIHVRKLSVEKKNWSCGPEYLSPVFEILPHKADGSNVLAYGRYLVMDGIEEVSGSLDNIIIEGLGTEQKTRLVLEEGKLYLSVEAVREPSTIVWTGSESNVWDFATTENFSTQSPSGESEKTSFVTGDKVMLDDTSSRNTIILNGDLEADTIIVDATKNYTFSGSGSIVGNSVLVKRGTGKLIVSNDNAFTGGIRLSGGTLTVSSLANANQPKGNLGGVTTKASLFVIENGAILQNTSNVTMGSPIQIAGEEGGVLQTDNTFQMQKPISGTLLTKKGSGTLVFFGTNTVQRMDLLAGTVDLRSGKPATAVVLQGGTLMDNASNTSHSIEVPKGKSATWQLSANYYLAYANRLIGEGTLTIVPTNTVNRVRITGNWSGFTGTIKHVTSKIWLPLDASTGLPNGTLDLADGCGVTNVCKSFTIGKLTGSGSLNHPVSNFQSGAAVSGNNTWRVGNSSEALGDFTFSGILHDEGGTNRSNFEKIGTCKMTVKGAWDNSGTVKVTEGEMFLASGSCLGKGALTVAEEATLSGVTATNGNLTNSSVTIKGTLRVGATATSTMGCMNFGNNNVTFNSRSILHVGVSRGKTNALSGCTTLGNINRLTMNGTIQFHYSAAAANNLSVGDSIVIWKAQSFAGTPIIENLVIDEEKKLCWDVTDLDRGILRVANFSPTGIKGDVNGDGVVNGTDIQSVINFIVANQYDDKADVNNDGIVNGTDIQEIINIIVTTG